MNAPATLLRPTVSKFLIVILGFVAFVTSFGAHALL